MTISRSPNTRGRRIQQREIAERAGVSISTVSRVLNNVPGISAALQQRVLSAASELGYAGGGALTLPMQQVGLFTSLPAAPSLDPFHADVLSGIEHECRHQGLHLAYATIGAGAAAADFLLERLTQNPVDGLLLMSVDQPDLLRQLLSLDLPIVTVNVDQRDLPVDSFLPDNWYGALLAMRHLIAHGHRRIAHMTWPTRSTIRQRQLAYQAALAEAGLAYDPSLVIEASLNAEEAYAAMKPRLAAGPPDWSAMFCDNDSAAMGVLRALQEAGLRVPEDVSLVGFDDVGMSAFLSPPLTTVRVERQELGALALRRLIERRQMPQLTPIRVEMACQLIERRSVAPPRR